MKAVVQRVSRAAVSVDHQVVAAIGAGLVILLGITHDDSEKQAAWLAKKIAGLRMFEDQQGKLNCSMLDVGGQALVVSQFTLYADCHKGRRPSFSEAADPQVAEPLVNRFAELLHDYGVDVQTGMFGAHMLVEIHNDGPVTLILEK